MGSDITAYIASKKPESVNTYILTGPVVKGMKWSRIVGSLGILSFTALKVKPLYNLYRSILIKDFYTYLGSKYVGMHNYDREKVRLYAIGEKEKHDFRAWIEMSKEVSTFDLVDNLRNGRNDARYKLVVGRYDRFTNPKLLTRASLYGDELYKRVEVDVIDNAGHVVAYEDGESTFQSIKSFILG
jgi:pimeloyl-ACP methyl ester carboxylesterase